MGEKGFTISGTSPDGALAELIELRDHPYFLACQYHPEFPEQTEQAAPALQRVRRSLSGETGEIDRLAPRGLRGEPVIGLGRGGSPNRPPARVATRPRHALGAGD